MTGSEYRRPDEYMERSTALRISLNRSTSLNKPRVILDSFSLGLLFLVPPRLSKCRLSYGRLNHGWTSGREPRGDTFFSLSSSKVKYFCLPTYIPMRSPVAARPVTYGRNHPYENNLDHKTYRSSFPRDNPIKAAWFAAATAGTNGRKEQRREEGERHALLYKAAAENYCPVFTRH